jgi:phospholipase C
MGSASTWERIERQKLHARERRARYARPGDRPDPSRPAGTDMLPEIRHIVVLMMENHSFDNYLGTWAGGRGSRSVTMAGRMPRILTPRAR